MTDTLNGHQDQADRPMISFGPRETEEMSAQLASDVLTILKRDEPVVFATAMARAWGIDLPAPKSRKPRGAGGAG